MKIYNQEIFISKKELKLEGLFGLENYMRAKIPTSSFVTRFIITETSNEGYECELDLLDKENNKTAFSEEPIFSFNKRKFENIDQFTAALLIPTGIGAEIGGHCGDGNAVARLIASACDTLITHPNVLNASDINEMTENTLYVEGSIITRLLMGKIGLEKVRANRLLVLMDKHSDRLFNDEIINAVSSARVTLGLECDVHEMNNLIESTSIYSKSGRATGEINNLEKLFNIIEKYIENYDAIALSTFIKVPLNFHKKYYSSDDMINPWGGIEAMLTHSIAEVFKIPCAHSPMMESSEIKNLELGIVDPRKAPESSSTTYFHCVLKGLHKAPRIVDASKGITIENISCVIVPDGCIGLPILSCLENDIPLIVVKENKNQMKNDLRELPFKKDKFFLVENYLEAVGIMQALKAGISPQSIRRPINFTNLI